MNDLIVHQVNIAHDRLIELTKLADVELIFEYRTIVKSFEWSAVREVVIDRLEGSRRSISGHRIEANIRTSLITAIQYYYSIKNKRNRRGRSFSSVYS